jgi:hypothetical protein
MSINPPLQIENDLREMLREGLIPIMLRSDQIRKSPVFISNIKSGQQVGRILVSLILVCKFAETMTHIIVSQDSNIHQGNISALTQKL